MTSEIKVKLTLEIVETSPEDSKGSVIIKKWRCHGCYSDFPSEPETSSGWPCYNKFCEGCAATKCTICVNCKGLRPKEGGIELTAGFTTYRDGESYSLPGGLGTSGWYCYRCGEDHKYRKSNMFDRF